MTKGPKLSEKKFDPKTSSLEEVREYLFERMAQGVKCPCCAQRVQLYERSIHASMAKVLIILHRHFEKDPQDKWVHVPTFLEDLSRQLGAGVRGGDWAKLRYWGLIEEKPKGEKAPTVKKDGNPRSGFYRVTERGHAFAKGELSVEKTIRLYNDQPRGFGSGGLTTIQECLGKEFDYAALMSGRYADEINFV